MLVSALLLALGATSVLGGPFIRSTYAVKGSHPVPKGWRALDRAPQDHKMELRIGLTQGDFKGLEKHLFEASNPKHNKYGNHLTADDVYKFIKPSHEASNAVHEWLYEHGVLPEDLEYTPAKDWIKINLPVSAVEDLLDTQYHTYVSEDGRTAVRTPQWSVPRHLHEHVSTIQPTSSFFGPRAQARMEERKLEVFMDTEDVAEYLPPPPDAATVAEVCNTTWVTLTCLRTLYGTIDYTPQSADKNTVAMNDFLGEVNIRSDTKLYLQNFRPEALGAENDYQIISIDGGTTDQTLNETQLEDGTGIEGNLDDQTLIGISWPTALEIYSTGGSPPFIPDITTTSNTNEPYLTWLEYVLSLPDPLPSVISTSYGDDEQTVPKDYAVQVCNALAQLGARGVSVLFASGDSGVGGSGECYTNDGRNASTFLPNFPTSSPYITSVGGTYKFNPEVPVFCNRSTGLYTAGGGVDALKSYFAATGVTDEFAGLFNPNGRAYPDISGQSLNFTIFWNGTLRPVSGTSASTPAVSGILALVNDALVAAGKPTLGFLNPWLYGGGYKAFNDVTTGSNFGCDTEGIPAVEGYDIATGWGTPNFKEILALRGVHVASPDGWGSWNRS
ncbi:hypothetical protein LTR70_006049 [Exophiala xenobiotica]|uniref:tripeptidyl-peptidase II n=1 Tax=Lithohypha guttulata TaxID=1690604 RepID=A0ABR0KFJ2_9EURO|nr:hypothetical protein LTR24_003294 [Lithohypha guttulata]KAK5316916.1 hypothetical protein LTR70_006049 [Exophiala xenobiotica]